MSVSQAPVKRRHLQARPVSMVETLIFAGGLLAAMLVGVASSGVLPAG
jgi:hypothetical protein